MRANGRITTVTGAVSIAFGILTAISGGWALFGGADMGALVPFVLWFNFLAGFAYMITGVGLWRRRAWAAPMALGILITTAAIFCAFGLHVLSGRPYEVRTVGAMSVRTMFWALAAVVARQRIKTRRSD